MDAYSSFVEAFHRHRLVDPNQCVSLGVDHNLDELPDPSLAASGAAVASAEALLETAEALPKEGLSFDESLDLALAELLLQREVHDETYVFNGRTMRQQRPTAGDDISWGLFTLFVNDPRPDEDRLANVTSRVEMVPDYLDALQRRLRAPVKRWVDIDREKVQGLPDLFVQLSAWAERVGFADAPRLERARMAAEAAIRSYADALGQLETTENLHVGEATARRIVELRGIEMSLERLHRVAKDFLADNRAQIEGLRGQLAAKYDLPKDATTEAVHQHLNQRFAVPLGDEGLDTILRCYEAEREKILAFIQARGLFPVPPNQEMKILRTPGFLEPTIPAGAMDSPAPFREGIRTSVVYLTLKASQVDEHTLLGIPGMMIHEGIPGHHLQLTHAALNPSVVRRHFSAMELAEGWTTMLEDYMLDIGYMGELTDEARFVGKMDIARIGARVGIDLFFMTGERQFLELGVVEPPKEAADPFEAAGAVLQSVTGFTPGRVQAELNWYSQERGYPLSYLAGNHLVWKLKRDLEAAQPGQADLDQRFHRIFLEAGNMPVEFLRRVFKDKGLLPS